VYVPISCVISITYVNYRKCIRCRNYMKIVTSFFVVCRSIFIFIWQHLAVFVQEPLNKCNKTTRWVGFLNNPDYWILILLFTNVCGLSVCLPSVWLSSVCLCLSVSGGKCLVESVAVTTANSCVDKSAYVFTEASPSQPIWLDEVSHNQLIMSLSLSSSSYIYPKYGKQQQRVTLQKVSRAAGPDSEATLSCSNNCP